MKAMSKIFMGKWVKFHKRVHKRTVMRSNEIKETSHPSYAIGSGYPQWAMIIGERWLPDGETRRGWGDESGEFTRTGTTHVILVVPGPIQKPFYVLIEDATLADDTPLIEAWDWPVKLGSPVMGGMTDPGEELKTALTARDIGGH